MKPENYTRDELVALIDRMGYDSGGEIEVMGLNGREEFSVMVAQTEWFDTIVCFVGGYGNPVRAIGRLPCWTTISTRIQPLERE